MRLAGSVVLGHLEPSQLAASPRPVLLHARPAGDAALRGSPAGLGITLADVRLVLAVLFEVGWELVENTDRVIMAYRESTIALNYHGDSIANSVSDVVTFVLGYGIAMRVTGVDLRVRVRGYRDGAHPHDPRQPSAERPDAAAPYRRHQGVADGQLRPLS
jgi:hypothetical protein